MKYLAEACPFRILFLFLYAQDFSFSSVEPMSYVYGIDKTKSSTQFGLLPPKLKSELNSTIATMLTILLKQHGVASVFTCITAYTCSHNSHCERVLFDSLFALICSRLLLLLVARHYCLLGLLHTVFGLFGIQMRLI